MARLLELSSGSARARIAPELGAAIADLWIADSGGGQSPILRPWTGQQKDGRFALANNILVPFSNRIREGFTFDGVRYDLERNMKGDYPIHGDGLQRAWEVTQQSDKAVKMTLEEGAFGPFRYRAELEYALSGKALMSTLSLTSTSDVPLPFGMGFHPWFPRTGDTRLAFNADAVWLVDDTQMPLEKVSIDAKPDWDFRKGAPLPMGFINNGFTGLAGEAVITQGPGAHDCRVTASDNLDVALVYSPGPDCGFFCFEPVSHPVDAHNMEGLPGLAVLAPGDSLSGWMRIAWD